MLARAGSSISGFGQRAVALARPASLLAFLLIVGFKLDLGGQVSAAWRQWQGLQVQRFLISTKAAYDAFDPGLHRAPTGAVGRFPAGTNGVSVYYELSAAVPGRTQVSLEIDGGRGRIGAFAPDVASSADFGMFEYLDLGQPLAPGVYRVELLLDGHVVANRPFQVLGGHR